MIFFIYFSLFIYSLSISYSLYSNFYLLNHFSLFGSHALYISRDAFNSYFLLHFGLEFEIYNKSTLTSDLLAIYLFLLLRISTHGGAREGIILGNLRSQPNEDGGKQEVIVPVSRAKPATKKSEKQKAKK